MSVVEDIVLLVASCTVADVTALDVKRKQLYVSSYVCLVFKSFLHGAPNFYIAIHADLRKRVDRVTTERSLEPLMLQSSNFDDSSLWTPN